MIERDLSHVRRRAWIPALLGLASLACASLQAPLTCPERGGAPWVETTSEHFVLRTDAAPDEARAVVARYERLWAALAFIMGRPQKTEQRFDLVRFARLRDMAELTDHDFRHPGRFKTRLPGDLEPRPTVLSVSEDLADEDAELFAHELTHRLLHERYAAIPAWLNEGLAKYYETLRIDAGRIVLGDPGSSDFSDRSYWWTSWRGNAQTVQIPAGEAPKVWDLVNTDYGAFHPGGPQPSREESKRETANYTASWKLVHYFLNGPDAGDRARFAAFLTAVERGARPRDAFLETFGIDLPRLEQAFHQYLTAAPRGRPTVEYLPAPGTAPPVERAMTDAEVHLLWARILFNTPELEVRRGKELDEALAKDPESPEVRYWRAIFFARQGRPDNADRELDAALAARPDEPRYLLARLVVRDDRLRARKARLTPAPAEVVAHLARTATSAWQLHVVALNQRRAHQSDEAAQTIQRALTIDPLCWECESVRATLLVDAGRPDEALAAVDRALGLLPDGWPPADLLTLRRKIVSLPRTGGPTPEDIKQEVRRKYDAP